MTRSASAPQRLSAGKRGAVSARFRLACLSPPVRLCAGPKRQHGRAASVALGRPAAHRRSDLPGHGGCGSLHRIARQMCVTMGCCCLGMAEYFTNDRQTHPTGCGNRAKACRRSWSRTSSRPATARIARHGFSRFTNAAPAFCPMITCGLPSRRGSSASTARAGAAGARFSRRSYCRVAVPRRARNRPTTTRGPRISPSLAPVNTSSLIAATAKGEPS